MPTEEDPTAPRLKERRVAADRPHMGAPGHLASVMQALAAAFRPASIDRADARELARIAVRYRIEANALVLRPGTRSDALWLVEAGRVSVGATDPHGQWRQTHSVGPGEWLDVASAWLGGPFLEAAKAVTPVVAHEFPLDETQVMCSLRPHLATLFLTAMAVRLRQATEAARDRGVRDVPSRLAAWLLVRMEPSGTGGGTVELRQHKRVLAAELGTSPETFSRALSRLRLLGLVAVRGYTVSVLDPEGLQRIAGCLPGSTAGPAASSSAT